MKDASVRITIRHAVESDAEEISLMAQEFVDFLCGLADDPDISQQPDFTPETVLRHGFGQRPWFHALMAEYNGKPVGYLLYHFGYWAEDALPSLHVADLFVREAARGRTVGVGADDGSNPDIPPEPGGHQFLKAPGRPHN